MYTLEGRTEAVFTGISPSLQMKQMTHQGCLFSNLKFIFQGSIVEYHIQLIGIDSINYRVITTTALTALCRRATG